MKHHIKDDGGRSKYFDHPSHYGDCVVRACAIATDRDYLDVFKDLCQIAIEIGDLPNAPSVYDEFLTRHGFTKNKPPKRNGKKIPIRDWVPDAPRGNIVAITRLHLVAIVDNVQRDTWLDERVVNSWYHK